MVMSLPKKLAPSSPGGFDLQNITTMERDSLVAELIATRRSLLEQKSNTSRRIRELTGEMSKLEQRLDDIDQSLAYLKG